MAAKKSAVMNHVLIPKHTKISDKEKKALFEKYNLIGRELPIINPDDPGIANLGAEPGDVILIERESHTAKKAPFYRIVVSK